MAKKSLKKFDQKLTKNRTLNLPRFSKNDPIYYLHLRILKLLLVTKILQKPVLSFRIQTLFFRVSLVLTPSTVSTQIPAVFATCLFRPQRYGHCLLEYRQRCYYSQLHMHHGHLVNNEDFQGIVKFNSVHVLIPHGILGRGLLVQTIFGL